MASFTTHFYTLRSDWLLISLPIYYSFSKEITQWTLHHHRPWYCSKSLNAYRCISSILSTMHQSILHTLRSISEWRLTGLSIFASLCSIQWFMAQSNQNMWPVAAWLDFVFSWNPISHFERPMVPRNVVLRHSSCNWKVVMDVVDEGHWFGFVRAANLYRVATPKTDGGAIVTALNLAPQLVAIRPIAAARLFASLWWLGIITTGW